MEAPLPRRVSGDPGIVSFMEMIEFPGGTLQGKAPRHGGGWDLNYFNHFDYSKFIKSNNRIRIPRGTPPPGRGGTPRPQGEGPHPGGGAPGILVIFIILMN